MFLGRDANAAQSVHATVAANLNDFSAHTLLVAACALAERHDEVRVALEECDPLR
jgi:hypothetical protein